MISWDDSTRVRMKEKDVEAVFCILLLWTVLGQTLCELYPSLSKQVRETNINNQSASRPVLCRRGGRQKSFRLQVPHVSANSIQSKWGLRELFQLSSLRAKYNCWPMRWKSVVCCSRQSFSFSGRRNINWQIKYLIFVRRLSHSYSSSLLIHESTSV